MTKEEVVERANEYLAFLKKQETIPMRWPWMDKPFTSGQEQPFLNHLHWMCLHILKIVETNLQDASDWTSWIQGALFRHGEFSIDSFRTFHGVKEIP